MKSLIITKVSTSPLPPIFIGVCFIVFLLTNTPVWTGLIFLGIVMLGWYIIYHLFGDKNSITLETNGCVEK